MWSRELPSRVASPPELAASDVTVSLCWHALTQTYAHAHTQRLNHALGHRVRQAEPNTYIQYKCTCAVSYRHRRWKTHNNWQARKADSIKHIISSSLLLHTHVYIEIPSESCLQNPHVQLVHTEERGFCGSVSSTILNSG